MNALFFCRVVVGILEFFGWRTSLHLSLQTLQLYNTWDSNSVYQQLQPATEAKFMCAISLRFLGYIPESYQTRGLCMDLSNHREGVFYQVQLLSSLKCILETIRGCVSLKKYKSQGKDVEVPVNSKETFVWISSKNSASGQFFMAATISSPINVSPKERPSMFRSVF